MDEKQSFHFICTMHWIWESYHCNCRSLDLLKCLAISPLSISNKVSKGDTFWFIAKRYGLDYKQLMALNPNVNP